MHMSVKRKVHIIYSNFADIENNKVFIGGIQNYIKSLNEVLKESYHVEIYQIAQKNDSRIIDNIVVNSFGASSSYSLKNIRKMFNHFSKDFGIDDIIIWGTDTIGFKSKFKNVIAIQHGITFDLMYYNRLHSVFRSNILGRIYKQLQCRKARRNFRKYDHVVCVDYNFLNWVRTQLPRSITDKAVVIPNYAEREHRDSINKLEENSLSILFARRFSFERGAELMLELIPKVLKKYPGIKFTLCGEGPYQKKLSEKLESFSKNVKITKFDVGESKEFNLKHHITLIPTIGSEGTSFSLLEGMACGAIPIASNVGGMTNIVIDGFNGFLVEPTTEAYFKAISMLAELEREKMKILSENARNTLEMGFDKLKWAHRWTNFIEEKFGNQNLI